MRTAFSFLFLIFTISAEANDNPGVSIGITPLNDDVRTAGTMTCKSPNYRGKTAACKTCAAKVEEWRTKFPDLTKKFTDQDNAFSLFGKKATGGTVAGVDNELAAFRAQQANAKAGAKTQADRAKNATEAKSEFDKCQEEINKACGGGKQIMLANSDKSVAEAVQKACEDASKKSGDFADQKKKDGGGMGDLSKLMDMASKAMQMAQQKGDDKDSPAQTPTETPPTAATPATATAGAIENNKLDGSGASQTPQIAFLTPKPTGDSNSSGSGLSGALSSDDRKPAHEGGGAPLPGGGSALPSAGAGGGGGGSGGGSGSGGGGASTAGAPVPNASTEAGSEINASGGLKSGGGGKSKDGGLDPIDPNSLAPLGDTAKTDEAPPPAEGEVAAPDVLASDSESIFLRVRSKYSFLKGSGRI